MKKTEKTDAGKQKKQSKPHLFQPGQSGNPSGRPKRTKEEKDALEAIKALAPDAVEKLSEMLQSEKVSPIVKVRICELILERTYGKPEASVRVTSTAQTVQESQAYILSLVSRIRPEGEEGKACADACTNSR